MIVERLARRCGYDAVAAVIPESDRKLLVHIRKERTKKEGRRHDDSGSQVCPPVFSSSSLAGLSVCLSVRRAPAPSFAHESEL